MKKILVIGATSAMAEHCARIWAARGDTLYLVARNQQRLQVITDDLKVRGAKEVHAHCTDLNKIDDHEAILDAVEAIMGGIDIVLIAHGSLSNQKICEKNVKESFAQIQTNVLSYVSLLTHIANRFEANQAGTIAVISSVAGDRGRASNYIYGASKAMISVFTSGLRQRLHKANVAVVTIKPGTVDTPMTAAFKKGPLWTKPDIVAKKIIKAIDARKTEVYIPAYWMVIMCLIRILPMKIFNRLKF